LQTPFLNQKYRTSIAALGLLSYIFLSEKGWQFFDATLLKNISKSKARIKIVLTGLAHCENLIEIFQKLGSRIVFDTKIHKRNGQQIDLMQLFLKASSYEAREKIGSEVLPLDIQMLKKNFKDFIC
jgi:hypothetical protein